jgi:hypothetical protein
MQQRNIKLTSDQATEYVQSITPWMTDVTGAVSSLTRFDKFKPKMRRTSFKNLLDIKLNYEVGL